MKTDKKIEEQAPSHENKTLQIKSIEGDILFESDEGTIKEAVEQAISKGARLKNADLKHANLRGIDLRGVDLSHAHLNGADLSGARLKGTKLPNTNFWGGGGKVKISKGEMREYLESLGVAVE